MDKTSILFRHFKTEDDLLKRHTPSEASPPFCPISEETLDQLSCQVASAVEKFGIKQVLLSDNIRGRKTAEMILKKTNISLEIYEDPRLRNMIQPEWIGLDYKDIVNSEVYKVWHTTPEKTVFKNGETLADVEERVKSLIEERSNISTLYISHTTPLQVLLSHLINIPSKYLWSFKFDFNRFTLIHNETLLKFNSRVITDSNLNELHNKVNEKRP